MLARRVAKRFLGRALFSSQKEQGLEQKGVELLTPGISRMSNMVAQRAQGSWLWTVDGTKYLDFTCGIGVTNTGHCHPHVTKAVQEQVGRLVHAQVNICLHEPMIQLAERLQTLTPPSLDTFFFWNSGSEAVEASVKLARQATGRPNIIAVQGGFHGRTFGAMALTTSKNVYRAGFSPLMGGVFVTPFPYARQLPASLTSEQARVDFCLEQLEQLLKQQTAPHETAAVILEPVLGEGGYVVPPAAYLKGVKEICSKHGILLICDEVQSGFGRTGKMFAVEHFGLVPDIMVMAKGLASGFPLSGIVSRRDLMAKQTPGSMGGTYAGNAVSCAAALATLDVFEKEKLLENAIARGSQITSRLKKLQAEGLPIGDVRGLGLMIGLEFDDSVPSGFAGQVSKLCRENGMLILTTSIFETLRLIPPLNVTSQEVDTGLSILEQAIRQAQQQ